MEKRGGASVWTASVGLGAILLLVASGCTGTARMYEGGRRSREEVAILRPLLHDLIVARVTAVEIVGVDGRELGPAHDSAELLPGSHVVLLSRGAGTGPKVRQELQFEAKAGRIYEVDAKQLTFNPPTAAFWIIDTADGSVVAGARPPAE